MPMQNLAVEQITQVQSLLEQSREIFIVLPKLLNSDAVASALALYLSLSNRGKQVSVATVSPITVEFNQLVGVNKIVNNFTGGNGRNLVISFPYQEGSIEKVSYNIEDSTFNLVIEPREGYPTITPEMIKYSSGGGSVDLIITVGSARLSDLDTLYTNNQAIFNEKPIINIDIDGQNTKYGRVNIVDPTISSIAELSTALISSLNLAITEDVATNLLAGITAGSNNFTSANTSPTTFETAALLLRSKARKTTYNASQPFTPQRNEFNRPRQDFQAKVHQPPFQQRQTQTPKFPPRAKPSPQQNQPKQEETPPDWLKPKIYKGSTLI